MLLGQYSRRREHSDLFSVHNGLERRANRHFRFAKPDVAANQAIHRLRTFHVDLCVDDRLHLVWRFPKRKGMFEFRLPSRIGSKRVAGMRLALCLDGKHFAGVIEDGSHGILLRSHPLRVPERAERRRFFSDADVTRDQIRLLQRDVELGLVGKLECENFLLWHRYLICGDREHLVC